MVRRRKFVFTIITVFCALVLIEAVGYLVLQCFASDPDPYSSETHILDAHRNHRLNPEFRLSRHEQTKLHSPNGFRRDTPVSVAKPKDTLRIIALGTSALYGAPAQAPYPPHRPLLNNETITFFLEERIKAQLAEDQIEYDVEIINAAVTAYNTFHHLIYVNSDLLEYGPDIFVNIDGHNDFYANRLRDRWSLYRYSTSMLVDEFNGRTFFLPLCTTTRALAPYSSTFTILDKLTKRIWYAKVRRPLSHVRFRADQSRDSLAENVEFVAEHSYLRDLWQIKNLGSYAGYDHYVFLQPEIVFEPDELLTVSDRKLKSITTEHMAEEKPERMKQMRDMFPAIFEKRGVSFFDVSQISSFNEEREDLYIDYCHLTPAGARITAERIYEVLYPKVVTKIRSLETKKGISQK